MQTFNITASQFSVESSFSESEATFNLKYPLAITKTGNTFTLQNFDEKITSSFGAMYNSAKEIAENSSNTGGLCFTCAKRSLSSRGIYGSIFNYGNSSYIMIITPEDTQVKNATMQFDIALGY